MEYFRHERRIVAGIIFINFVRRVYDKLCAAQLYVRLRGDYNHLNTPIFRRRHAFRRFVALLHIFRPQQCFHIKILYYLCSAAGVIPIKMGYHEIIYAFHAHIFQALCHLFTVFGSSRVHEQIFAAAGHKE